MPVPVSASTGRKFVATILTAKGRHHRKLATARLTLKRHGKGTVKVRLSQKLRPGRYLIQVRAFTLKGRAAGRLLQRTFTLK